MRATVMFLKRQENDSKCEILTFVVLILEDFFSATAFGNQKEEGQKVSMLFLSSFCDIYFLNFGGIISCPRYARATYY